MDATCKHCGQPHPDRTCCKRVGEYGQSRICELPAVGVADWPSPFSGTRYVCEEHAQSIEERSRWSRSRVHRFEPGEMG